MPTPGSPAALLLTAVLATAPAALAQEAEDGFRPLFNGRDLTGWVNVNTAPSTWTVRDGLLVCSGKPIGELRTDRMYQNFVLELEWRHLRPKGNAGVFVWADDITARGQPFHRGIEVQVLDGMEGSWFTSDGDIFPIHGARMTPVNGRGGSRAFPTEKRAHPSPEWNHYRITCEDGRISLAVNGKVVTRGTDCTPRKGYICLESEGGLVHYRNVRIKQLPATPIDPAHVAIADRGFRSLYTGVDLSGWKVAAGAAGHWKASNWTFFYDGGSDAEDRSIRTVPAFGDFGFIFDVRRHQDDDRDSGHARVQLRGASPATIHIAPEDPLIGDRLGKPGRWNRFSGTLVGNRLTLRLNGETLFEDREIAGLPARGPIRILPDGPIDFANVYVREAGPSTD